MRVHLDTDLGSTVDDLAALLMLLGADDVELTGITTCLDPGGQRAGLARSVLATTRTDGVPVAAGAEESMTSGAGPRRPFDTVGWPEGAVPAPGDLEVALGLLRASIVAGAMVLAIGPLTNLALLASVARCHDGPVPDAGSVSSAASAASTSDPPGTSSRSAARKQRSSS